MLDRRSRRLGLLFACVAGVAIAESPSSPPASSPATNPGPATVFDAARHMATSEVKPGMKGYGLSVFRGTAIEQFGVEVISVLRNQDGANHNIVLIQCSGQGLEHSGAIQGMSGSPIYLTDANGRSRLIGAFALGWENNKDPIAGVRPIEEMLRVPSALSPTLNEPAKRTGKAAAWNALSMIRTNGSMPSQANPAGNARNSLTRFSLPLSVSGLGASAFDRLAPALKTAGFVPLQGGAVSSTDVDAKAKLEPGAAVGLPIVSGDLDVSAIGTVTEVIGNKLFAFGHEFNSEGAVDLPMGLGYIHTIIPANTISFKMGSLVRLDGAIHSDESVAVAGEIGRVPAMIPVTVTVRTPQRPAERTFKFNVARHPKFTPMGITTAITGAITADSGLPADFTVKYAMNLKFDNGQTLALADTTTSAAQAQQLQRDVNLPLALALNNPFGRSYPTAITATFEVDAKVEQDELKSAVSDKAAYKPGEAVSLFVTTLSHDGTQATKHVPFELPDKLPEGGYTLSVGDADHALADATRDAPYRYQARNLDEVFGIIKEITARPSKQIYVRLASQGEGVAIGRTPLRGLPASKARVLAKAASADVQAFAESLTGTIDWPRQISGSAEVAIRVSRNPDKEPRQSSNALPTLPGLPASPPTVPDTSAADR